MTAAELNFKHLRYFWTVARAGTIAEAGRLLGLAPHSISAQLATFEAALGVTLFRRSGRRLVLTEAGELLASFTQDALIRPLRTTDTAIKEQSRL